MRDWPDSSHRRNGVYKMTDVNEEVKSEVLDVALVLARRRNR